MPTFRIKRNDTRPYLTATLLDGDSALVDLTGCSATLVLANSQGQMVFEKAANIDPDQTAHRGEVWYEWEAEDTAYVGTYRAEFEVTFTDATTQSFPTRGHIWVKIYSDLDTATLAAPPVLNGGGSGGPTAWTDITGKPATFTPAEHDLDHNDTYSLLAHTHPTEWVVTWPTGSEPSLVGIPDGTVWIEYTP